MYEKNKTHKLGEGFGTGQLCRFGAEHLGAVSYFFFSYEEKTMKQVISGMPLSANLLKLESSILPRVKRATNRNNVATEKLI